MNFISLAAANCNKNSSILSDVIMKIIAHMSNNMTSKKTNGQLYTPLKMRKLHTQASMLSTSKSYLSLEEMKLTKSTI